jgi:glycosyltransferase involved in cell wall biosynthesis
MSEPVARGPARPTISRRKARILFLHHSGGLDGSLVSLRELLRFLDRDRFEPLVALLRPGEEARRAIEEVGVATVRWPGIAAFNHATAFWSDLRRPRTWPPLLETALRWRSAQRSTLRLVEETRPDLVHVNSVVLAPSAAALRRSSVPSIWHVRETPVRGHAGIRRRFQRGALLEWPSEVIFLSEVARREWVGGARGVVIPELVDPGRFDFSLDASAARRELGIREDAPVVLYLGGMVALKGFVPLLRALTRVVEQVPEVVCLMPGADAGSLRNDPSALVRAAHTLGVRTELDRLEQAFRSSRAERSCIRLPFSSDVPRWLAASDVLVFPATQDHFPRPVVEAGFMEKPIVASRLPMIEEAVRDGESGILVPPEDPRALADAVVTLLRDPTLRRAMGRAGRANALRRFDAATNARATMDVYERLLAAVL